MPALQADLHIEQGTTWSRGFRPTVGGIDLLGAGWQLKAQVRKTASSADVLHEWSTEAGNAEVTNGVAVLLVSPDESASWTWVRGVYDLEATHDGVTYRLAQGRVTVSTEVTR